MTEILIVLIAYVVVIYPTIKLIQLLRQDQEPTGIEGWRSLE